mgnify:FL=1|jgi:magnesium transporter
MSEKNQKKNQKSEAKTPLTEVSQSMVDYVQPVIDAITENKPAKVRKIISELQSYEIANLIQNLNQDQRDSIIEIVRDDLDPEVLAELDDTVREEVLEKLGTEEAAAAISELDSDDAVDVIEDLEEETKKKILKEIPKEERVKLRASLSYPEESAGRLMQREYVSVKKSWSVGNIMDFLRSEKKIPEDFYDIFVIDSKKKLVGSVPLSRLLKSRRTVLVSKIMETALLPVAAEMDQEEVAFLFRKRNLTSSPVINKKKELVGVITIDDVVDVIDEEAGEDIMRLGGVAEDDFYGAVMDTTKSRFRWLFLNLGTAFLASYVISFFESTIDKVVALAILMPIVASMGGIAGTQTLTVAVRAIAMKELTETNALRAVRKELIVGSVNGLLFALITGFIAWWWFGDVIIGSIIAAAMVINLIVAALAGAAIPLGLNRLGIDPAIASGTFLTTITDVVGFLAFLGLAALVFL